ncbi:MAG: hypothetical protein WBE20_11740 [Candidatus Acidiferrales bacterium]
MKRKTGVLVGMATLACLSFSPVLCAQQTQSQQQGQQSTQQTQPPSLNHPAGQQAQQAPAQPAPKVDPKEEADYKALLDMAQSPTPDVDKEIQASEDFLKNYPQSHYRAWMYSRLTNLYYQKRDIDKMLSTSAKALELNPDDVSVLVPVGWVMPRVEANAPDFPDRLAKAEQYEKHALELLPTLPKPPQTTDDQFAKSKANAASQAHSGLGLVYFRESKYQESVDELQQAMQVATDTDPVDFLVLGTDLDQLQKFADASKAYDSCAALASSLQDTCKQKSAAAKAKAASQPAPHKP